MRVQISILRAWVFLRYRSVTSRSYGRSDLLSVAVEPEVLASMPQNGCTYHASNVETKLDTVHYNTIFDGIIGCKNGY